MLRRYASIMALFLATRRYSLGVFLHHPWMRIKASALRGRGPLRFAIGDSHSDYTFRGIPDVVRVAAGPVTMHRIGRDGLRGFFLFRDAGIWKTSMVRPGDTVLFCFGEIDCRCHIARQVSDGKDEHEILEELAEAYVQALSAVRIPGATFRIVSVPPPAYGERIRYFRSLAATGSDADRARYTAALNAALRRKASEHGFGYLDLFSVYADGNGMLNPALSDGWVHIADTGPMRKILEVSDY